MKFLDFCFVAAVMCAVTNSQPLCLAKFSRFDANHTACLPPPTGDRKPSNEGVSPSNRKYILDMHNYYRGTVHRHGNQPQATNMQKMYWDDELAMVAQKWASNCVYQHDDLSRRSIPGKYPIGQNLAKGQRGWGVAIRDWQSEVRYLDFGKKKLHSNRPIGHYTQMVWADSARLGCGYARCNRTQAFYVCNYGPTGNMADSLYTPYIAGETASACPDMASAGLCDCEGKVCYNGGTLDLKTCQCRCLNKQWIRQDGDCSLDCSRAADSFACASNGGRWGEEACKKYASIPFEYCPLMCNLCSSITAGTSAPRMTPTVNVEEVAATQPNTSDSPDIQDECVDYENRERVVGDVWMNRNGEMRCTSRGVEVRRGCYIEKAAIVINEGDEHNYTDGNINWMCTCKVGYSLYCRGVYSHVG